MAQRPTNDFDIDPDVTSGTQLAIILNNQRESLDSTNSGPTRPTYMEAGGLWVKTPEFELYMFDGTEDKKVGFDKESGDFHYINAEGDTMTGTLIVPGIVINGVEVNSKTVPADAVPLSGESNKPVLTTAWEREWGSGFGLMHSNEQISVIVQEPSAETESFVLSGHVWVSVNGVNYCVAPNMQPLADLQVAVDLELSRDSRSVLMIGKISTVGNQFAMTRGWDEEMNPRALGLLEANAVFTEDLVGAVSVGAGAVYAGITYERIVAFTANKLIEFEIDPNASEPQSMVNVLTQDIAHTVSNVSVMRGPDGQASSIIEVDATSGKVYAREVGDLENESELALDYNGEADIALAAASDGYSTVILPRDGIGYLCSTPGQEFSFCEGNWIATDTLTDSFKSFVASAGTYLLTLDNAESKSAVDHGILYSVGDAPKTITGSVGIYPSDPDDDTGMQVISAHTFKARLIEHCYVRLLKSYDRFNHEVLSADIPYKTERLTENGKPVNGYNHSDTFGVVKSDGLNVSGVSIINPDKEDPVTRLHTVYSGNNEAGREPFNNLPDPYNQMTIDRYVGLQNTGDITGDRDEYDVYSFAQAKNTPKASGCWQVWASTYQRGGGSTRFAYGDTPTNWFAPDISHGNEDFKDNWHIAHATCVSHPRGAYYPTPSRYPADSKTATDAPSHFYVALGYNSRTLKYDIFWWEEGRRELGQRALGTDIESTRKKISWFDGIEVWRYSSVKQFEWFTLAEKVDPPLSDLHYFAIAGTYRDLGTEVADEWNHRWAVFDVNGDLISDGWDTTWEAYKASGPTNIERGWWDAALQKIVLFHGFTSDSFPTDEGQNDQTAGDSCFTFVDPVARTVARGGFKIPTYPGGAQFSSPILNSQIGEWEDGAPKIAVGMGDGYYLLPRNPETGDWKDFVRLGQYSKEISADDYQPSGATLQETNGIYWTGITRPAGGYGVNYTKDFSTWYTSYFWNDYRTSTSGHRPTFSSSDAFCSGRYVAVGGFYGLDIWAISASPSPVVVGGQAIATRDYVDSVTGTSKFISVGSDDEVEFSSRVIVGQTVESSTYMPISGIGESSSAWSERAGQVEIHSNGYVWESRDARTYSLFIKDQALINFSEPQIGIQAAYDPRFGAVQTEYIAWGYDSAYRDTWGIYPEFRCITTFGDSSRSGTPMLTTAAPIVQFGDAGTAYSSPLFRMQNQDNVAGFGYGTLNPAGSMLQVNGSIDSTTLRLSLDEELSEALVSRFGSDIAFSEHHSEIVPPVEELVEEKAILDDEGKPVLDENGSAKRERVVMIEGESERVFEKSFDGVDLKKLVVAMAKRILELEEKINGDAP